MPIIRARDLAAPRFKADPYPRYAHLRAAASAHPTACRAARSAGW